MSYNTRQAQSNMAVSKEKCYFMSVNMQQLQLVIICVNSLRQINAYVRH